MKKILFSFFLACFSISAFTQGFQKLFFPNLNQYDHAGFYISGDKMFIGGSYYNTKNPGVIIVADTSGNLLSSWTFDEASDWGLRNIRKADASNLLVCGKSYVFPNSGMMAKINHTNGTIAFAKYYQCNIAFGNAFVANDAIALSNGDFAITGAINENLSGGSCPSNFGGAYGYLKGWWGTSSYRRADDVCVVRTDGNGDTLWTRQYSLAYDGNGTFQFGGFPADSTREDNADKIIEVGTDMFIAGYTSDYKDLCGGTFDKIQAFVMKINSGGTLQWCKTYYLSTNPTYEYGMDVAPVSGGDLIALMRSDNSGNVELCRISGANGNIVWAKSYDFGGNEFGWNVKATSDGNFIVSITTNPGSIAGYDMILLKIDPNGTVLNKRGIGTADMDGEDSWGWYGAECDEFSSSSYGIAGVSNYSGGPTGSSYVAKIMNASFSTGCASHEFAGTVTVTDRNSGGASQISSRTPVVYTTSGGMTVGALTLTASAVTPTVNTLCILPVELISFSGKKINYRETLLNWITASEENNNYFTIERSEDGNNFSAIGNIAGAGTSSTMRNYEFIDKMEMSSSLPQTIFYRLKQTDFNGKFSYSQIISVEPNDNDMVSVFINEPLQTVDFTFTTNEPERISFSVYDVLGKKLFTKNMSEEKGYNKISIPLQEISNGSYLASFSIGEKIINKKFLINCKR